MKRITFTLLAFLAANLWGQQVGQVGDAAGFSARYATDAYPGFDEDKDLFSPERKEPKWFAFINGPKKDNASDQLAYCHSLEAEENWSKAAKHYDALVREWPTSVEAVEAQRRLAEILYEKEDNLDDALDAYRYLIDFYSFRCDYDAATSHMYEVACKMEEEGKTVLFFRFRNTVGVRHAFEGCVLRAPGAQWAPKALLKIAGLREDEGKYAEAVEVHENLRNLHYDTEEARIGILREAKMRMLILDKHGYNRSRCQDTVDFLQMALSIVPDGDVPAIQALLVEAREHLEDEAYKAAKFYDSRMRTKRSAIAAYERFLMEFPDGNHAETVRVRLTELKGGDE